MKNIILCGGSGTRLWPLSRKLMPKQFLKLFREESLFQKTLKRNKNVADEFLIITNEDHYFLALDQLEELGMDGEFLLEGSGRNTAAAIALAAFQSDEEEMLFITPADHLIDGAGYYEAVKRAKELAKGGALVTFGIEPSYPECGYGYIEADGEDVVRFLEKPSIQKAQEFIKKGNFYWNSGMFCFQAGRYLEELQKYRPDIYEASKKAIESAKRRNGVVRVSQEAMEKIPAQSIDYAVMEKSDRIKVVPSSFQWSDMGSFDALSEVIDGDKAIEIESKDNFILSKRKVALVGVEGLIVIDTPDALLIVKKGESQKVKEVVRELEGSELLQSHVKVHRPWGTYEVLIDEDRYKIKRLVVKPGKRLSLQKHFHRNEHWIVVSGTAQVQVGDKVYLVRANESTYIKMGEVHRLSNPGKIPVVLIEAQVGEYTGEDDIVRLEDDYARD